MRKLLTPPAFLVAALLALAAGLPFVTTADTRHDSFFFEAEVASSTPGMVQLFYDVGRGFNEADSRNVTVPAGPTPTACRFPLAAGVYRALRFDPLDRAGTVTIAHARIVDRAGHEIRAFKPGDFHAAQQIDSMTVAGERLTLVTTPQANDPILAVRLDAPLDLTLGGKTIAVTLVSLGGMALAVTLLLNGLLARHPGRRLRRLADFFRARPAGALLAAAAAAVAVQCNPVLFFGRSFVSPNNGVFLLYDSFPTLPGYASTDVENAMGADIGALMWSHLNLPVIEHEALFKSRELPLWNRYDLAGTPLLGQGQSMFGDPLNWLTIAADGASWAWDVRFLLLRVFFAFGTGLAVWLLARHLGAALLVTFSVVFIGFFAFRFNHPAIFSVCWSPWILVGWCWLLEAGTRRGRNLALAALVLAHGCMLTSGTIKEAAALTVCLDLAGVCLMLTSAEAWRPRLVRLGWAAFAGVVFLLLSAPLWLVFLDTLRKSHTYYDTPGAAQISPALFLGLFEDLFYRQLRPGETMAEPSTNFVVLFGLLWALAALRSTLADRRFVAVAAAACVPIALVFGLVPAGWIVRVPFLANVIHIDNTFSCPLLVLLPVLAGFGFAQAARQLHQPGWLARWAVATALLGLLAAVYFVSTRQTAKSPFFDGYAAALFLILVLAPPAIWLAARRRQPGAVAAAVAGGLLLLLWRHGQYLAMPFDDYVVNPKVRVDLAARSPAVDFVDARMRQPARIAGVGHVLFPGYNERLGWESIYGVDAVRNPYLDELARLTPLTKITEWAPARPPDVGKGLPMQDLMNVRYYLTDPRTPPLPLSGRGELASLDLDVYESPTAWPRAYFTDRLATYPSAASFVSLTLHEDGRPFAAVQEKDRGVPDAALGLSRELDTRTFSAAYGYELTDNTTTFTVQASGPGVIVLSESYYPGDFEVTVNGEPASYFRADHAFKGVYVDRPGTYEVTFRYWPEPLTCALWLSGAGVLLALGTFLAERRLAPRGSSSGRPGSP